MHNDYRNLQLRSVISQKFKLTAFYGRKLTESQKRVYFDIKVNTNPNIDFKIV